MIHRHRQSTEHNAIAGRVTTRLFDVDELRESLPGWDDLTELERWLALRTDQDDVDLDRLDLERAGVDPAWAALLRAFSPPMNGEGRTTNTTVDGLHQYLVDNLDPNQATNEDASYLAVGTDSTAPTSSDTALGNEAYRTSITDVIDNGKDLTTSTFLDSTEANGNTLVEVGLYTASSDGTLLNHATISSIAKDSTKTATIDVELQFRAA